MSGLKGVNDMKQFVLPVGWDALELQKFQLSDGVTYDTLVDDIAAALVATGGTLLDNPIYGGLVSETTEPGTEYRTAGGTRGMQKRTEYARGDAKRAATVGHMWPIESYDRWLGWTYDFLRKARRSQVDADIAAAIDDVQVNWETAILTRFFSSTENLLGSSGYDLPFANASTNVPFAPPAYDGQPFLTTHTHFGRFADDGTGRAAALEAGAAHLWEHGIPGPYNAIVPLADVAAFSALANFVHPDRGIRYVQVASGAGLSVADVAEPFFGLYETQVGLVRLWATAHVPTDYLGMYRSYGTRNMQNPLKVRYAEDFGIQPILLRGEGFRQYPLENAVILHEFGVGVGNRLNGYAAYFAGSGSYTTPTIV